MERIGYYAFSNSNLTAVTIPDSVQIIDDCAFEYGRDMTNVFIGAGVTYIGYYAFSGCEGIDNVYYGGDESKWTIINISEGNDCLANASMHFGATEIDDSNIISVTSVDDLQSKHPYANNTDKTWIYTYPDNANCVYVTFSEDTYTEAEYDYIYIYDEDDNEIGCYSGSELASKTIKVTGNIVKIRLTSDGSAVREGFAVTNIYAITGPITNLKYTSRTQESVTLSFLAPKEASSVSLEQSVDGKSWSVATTAEDLNASSTVATVIGLEQDTQYHFRLNIVGGTRAGISNEISVIPYALYTPADCFEFSDGTITKYVGEYTDVAIPLEINGENVTSIGHSAFEDCSDLTSVIIPDSVTSIAVVKEVF